MIKFYEPCKINKMIALTKLFQKINNIKGNENYYPVGIYIKKNKIIGILSLGDIRRIALKKVNFKDPAINYLNRKTVVINSDLFNADLINKLNFFKKKRKINFDFIIYKDKKN